jgi:uncharacterized protein (DUF2267 family)
MSRVTALSSSLQKTEGWLAELAEELGWPDSQPAYVVLRATLHALRDRLTVDEAAQLAAQLPLVVRGIYFEGWDPSATPRPVRDLATFLEPIERALRWEPDPGAERAASAVFALLVRHLTRGEIDDVIGALPGPIRELFPARTVAAWESREAARSAAF